MRLEKAKILKLGRVKVTVDKARFSVVELVKVM